MEEKEKKTVPTEKKATGSSRRTFFLGMLTYRRNRHGAIVVRPVWKNLGLWFLILSALGAVGSYLALFIFFRFVRGWEMVNFTDIALVAIDRPAFREKVGDAQFELAKQYFEEGRAREGLMYLQQSTVRAPANRDARLLFAQFQVSVFNRPDRAVAILDNGLRQHGIYDEEYLRALIDLMVRYEQDASLITLYEWMQEEKPEEENLLIGLALSAANAHFNQGRFEQALAILDSLEEHRLLPVQILLARIDWERGRSEEAINRLERISHGGGGGQVNAMLVNFYRQLGNLEAARLYGHSRIIQEPGDLQARIEYMVTLNQLGQTEAYERQKALLLREQIEVEQANALLVLALQTRDEQLGRAIFEISKQGLHNYIEKLREDNPEEGILPAQAMELSQYITAIIRYIDLKLALQQFEEASRLLTSLESDLDGIGREYFQHLLNGYRGVINFGLGRPEEGDRNLSRFRESGRVRPENILLLSQRLLEMEEYAVAKRLLSDALVRRFPGHRELLQQRLRIGLITQDEQVIDDLEQLLDLRRMNRDLMERSFEVVSSDRYLFHPNRNRVWRRLERTLDGDGTS